MLETAPYIRTSRLEHDAPRRTAERRLNRKAAVVVGAVALSLAAFAILRWLENPARGLPYHAVFANAAVDRWKAYAGTWEVVNGSMRNSSDDRGAKLITGSPYWKNYVVEADVQLLGSGDAGLMARVSDAEPGVDSYTGYYAGLRTSDGALVLGEAHHGWHEFPIKLLPGGVQPFHWYHLRLGVNNCAVFATASTPGMAGSTTITNERSDCPKAGSIGLRSYYSGGSWRNVVVHRSSDQGVAAPPASMLPTPEPAGERSLLADYITAMPGSLRASSGLRAQVQSIASLRFDSPLGSKHGAVRGQVILTAPRLFVQDSTGGVAVRALSAPSLKIGDEVEVTGVIRPRAFGALLDDADVRLLWEASASPPLSVTANQAANGAFSGMFVQIEGLLTGISREPDGTALLRLDSGAQSFRALLNAGRIASRLDDLRIGSTLRLRGVCVVDSLYTGNTTPFALLIPSAEDVESIAGPPWYSARSLIPFGIAIAILLAIANHLYILAKHWRLRAIVEERGRLAHEIHDTLAQSFAGIGYQLRAVSNSLPPNANLLRRQVDLACDMVRHSHEEARHSILTLRPEYLELAGLPAALKACGERMAQNGPLVIHAFAEGGATTIPLRIKDTLFRIGQEAIANAIRHADAKRIEIRVRYARSSITLSVSDDGVGFCAEAPPCGFGLIGMRKRAKSISAHLNICSFAGRGTDIQVSAPLPAPLPLTSWPLLLLRQFKGNGKFHNDPHTYRG